MSYSFDHSGSGFPLAEAVPSTPAQQQQQPGTSSALFKVAARNLREYHGVPSMSALKLEKTVTLLGLRPRRLVAQGLAPRRLLKDNSSPLVLAGGSSDEGQKALCEADSGALMDPSGDEVITNNYSSSEDTKDEDEEVSCSARDDDGDSIDNINLNIGDNEVDDAKEAVEGLKAGKKKRPIHAALVAGGIDLLPYKDTPSTTDRGTDAGMGTTLAAFKAREREGQANICATHEVVGVGSMVLVATEEGWVGLEALPMARPMLTGALNTAVLLATEEVGRGGLQVVPGDHRADRLGDISTDCSTSRSWRHTDDGTYSPSTPSFPRGGALHGKGGGGSLGKSAAAEDF
eukprot:jgi/Undpi1/13545/HiC_scaffold_8.g03204.m1